MKKFSIIAILALAGCGEPFVGVVERLLDDPCVVILDPGRPQAPTQEVIVPLPKKTRPTPTRKP
jgi:hypothetical protein